MQNVTVKRDELLSKLRENRASHRHIFEQAQVKYREAAIIELDRMLEDARLGSKIRRHVMLPEPEDHTSDYDRVLAMLEMSVDEEITLSSSEFAMYVLDQWGWVGSFASNTRSYTENA